MIESHPNANNAIVGSDTRIERRHVASFLRVKFVATDQVLAVFDCSPKRPFEESLRVVVAIASPLDPATMHAKLLGPMQPHRTIGLGVRISYEPIDVT